MQFNELGLGLPGTTAELPRASPMCQGKLIGPIDFEQIAKTAVEFSGADLNAVIDLAVEEKLRDAMRTGVLQPLSTGDLTAADASAPARRNGSRLPATTRSTRTMVAATTTS